MFGGYWIFKPQEWQNQMELIRSGEFGDLSRRAFVHGIATASVIPFLHSESMAVERQQGLLVHGTDPMNAEPKLPELVKSWITPTKYFYIRSHAPVPDVDTKAFRLAVTGLVDRPLSISLGELKDAFKQHSATCTLTCAGNRRTEHSLIKPVKGVPWEAGAIGNATWSGARLSDVLKRAGLKSNAKHVWFEGLDQIKRSSGVIPFGGSVPLEKAINDSDSIAGALLTTHMNGQPLNGDHGAPLRMVVPGYIGARSVKWLGKIVVSDRPSPNHYVANAYKLVTQGDKLEWAEQAPIYRMPLNSVICKSSKSARPSQVAVAGYALPQGRAAVTVSKVEVSADDGKSWTQAKISSPAREYCWALWSANVAIGSTTSDLIVRATDSTGKTQPQHVDWNMKGYLFNAWHRARIRR
jgi:sulfite oxidase